MKDLEGNIKLLYSIMLRWSTLEPLLMYHYLQACRDLLPEYFEDFDTLCLNCLVKHYTNIDWIEILSTKAGVNEL